MLSPSLGGEIFRVSFYEKDDIFTPAKWNTVSGFKVKGT